VLQVGLPDDVMSEPASSDSCCVAAGDLIDLMNALKIKHQAVKTIACEKNKIITLVPGSCSVRKTFKLF
jgi:hypothetical protein